MLPALQPSRPKHPQQAPRSGHNYQQTRAVHEQLQYQPPSSTYTSSMNEPTTFKAPTKPQNQIEAMPPFATPPHHPLNKAPSLYDSAIRHPVFFTQQLRKPPFPIPNMASHGWNPVASGYIVETMKPKTDGAVKTKL